MTPLYRVLLAMWLLGCGWVVAASENQAPAYVLVVDASGSMLSTGRKDLFDPTQEPGQTRWAFMRDAIERFLGTLEEGTELYLQLFADEPLEPIPYLMDREGQRVAEILRDIELFDRTPAFAGYAARHSQKGHPQGWAPRKQFVQRTALFETVLSVSRLVKQIAREAPSRPVDILFYADGKEEALGYRDSRLRTASIEQRRSIVSGDFERLVREQGFRNTWLYFTWIVNKSQFSEIYRKALIEGTGTEGLDPQTAELLRQPPLISTPENHIVYDLPYPRLSVAVTPREVGLANPREKPAQTLGLGLAYSDKAAKFLDGQPLGLRILGSASSWLKVVDGPHPMKRGEVGFRLEVTDSKAVRADNTYEAEAELVFPAPDQLGGAKVMGPPRIRLRFAALKRPDLTIQSPRPGDVHSTSKPIRLAASAPNAQIEWRLEDGTVLQGEQHSHTVSKPQDRLKLEVIARDKDHPKDLVSRREIQVRVEDVRTVFDRFPGDADLMEGKRLEFAIHSSTPLDRYHWTINLSDPEAYGAKVIPRADGQPGSVLQFAPPAAGIYSIRATGTADRFPGLEVAAQPDPLRLDVEPVPQITWAAPHTDRYAYQTSNEPGIALRAEVYGPRFDQVGWQVETDPPGVDFPTRMSAGLKTLRTGWRAAETALPPVTESMGISGLRLVAKATSTVPDVAPLETPPFEIRFFPPERDLVLVSPPHSADLHFDEGEVEFVAEIIGPPPKNVRWEILSPEGKSLVVSEEPVSQGENGKRWSRFRYRFSDPGYLYRQRAKFQFSVTGQYGDGKKIAGQQGRIDYLVRHAPKEFSLSLEGDPTTISYNQRVQFNLRQSGIEAGGAPDLETLFWRLTDAAGTELAKGQSGTSGFLIDLGEIKRPSPYGNLVLHARVRQRSGDEAELPPTALPVRPNPPQMKVLVDGEERSAVNLIFGSKLTIQDRSIGDIVGRRWMVTHQDLEGNVISEGPFGTPYTADLPVESRPWGELDRTEYRVTLLVTDPEGKEHGAGQSLRISLIPPHPWWLLTIPLLLTLPYYLLLIRPFIGNQPMRWAVRFRECLRSEVRDEDENGTPKPLCRDWDRWHKWARKPMSAFSADDYWRLGGGGHGAKLEVRRLGPPESQPEVSAAIIYERANKDPQGPERTKSGVFDEFWFTHPQDERKVIQVRILKATGRSCPRAAWDWAWLGLLASLLTAGWGMVLWYVLR